MNTTSQPENPYASPQSEEAPVVSNPTPAWRDGELVVVAPDGELPRRCAKCGGEASGGLHYAYLPKPEPMNWRRVALYIAIAFSFVALFPMIAGVLSTKKMVWLSSIGKIDSKHIGTAIVVSIAVSMPVLHFHIARKRRPDSLRYSLCWRHTIANRIAKVGMNLMASFWMIVMVVQPRLNLLNSTSFIFIFFILFMLVILISTERFFFAPKEITRRNELVWLKGAGPAFRDSLPEFPPELAISKEEH